MGWGSRELLDPLHHALGSHLLISSRHHRSKNERTMSRIQSFGHIFVSRFVTKSNNLAKLARENFGIQTNWENAPRHSKPPWGRGSGGGGGGAFQSAGCGGRGGGQSDLKKKPALYGRQRMVTKIRRWSVSPERMRGPRDRAVWGQGRGHPWHWVGDHHAAVESICMVSEHGDGAKQLGFFGNKLY